MATNLKTKGVILRRTNYKEADRILTVLTPDNGQLAVIARGVRKEKSRLAGGIELFAECNLTLVKSSMNIDGMWTLTSATIEYFYDNIMTDYDRLQFGYEVIKRIANLSSMVESPDLYDLIKQAFVVLDKSSTDLGLIKAWFYVNIAKLQGSELNLVTDSNGMKLVEDANYQYSVPNQVFVFSSTGPYDSKLIKLLRLMSVNGAAVISRLNGLDDKTIANALYLAQVAAEV